MTSPLVSPPKFEHHHSGFGIGSANPRLSWQFQTIDGSVHGWVQTAYEVEVKFIDREPQTFNVSSTDSVLVPWPARSLLSRESAIVRVRVTGKSTTDTSFPENTVSEWSPPSTVETALLDKDDFKASFITSAIEDIPDGPIPPIRLQKQFSLPEDLGTSVNGRLYITALGVFEVYINGKLASDECMAPGWTSYKHRLSYRIIDVGSLLLLGQENLISVEIGEGWYAGRLGFLGGSRFHYGNQLALFAQLEVRKSKSSVSEISWQLLSDDSWLFSASAIQSSEIYDGEVYDMRKEIDVWNTLGSKTLNEGLPTKVHPWPSAKLIAPDAPPVRVTETKAIVNIFLSKSGKTILDFGQNLVGKLLVKSLTLQNGEQVTFKHAEVMEHEELGTRPLRIAKCTDTIIGSGATVTNWTPKFTFHGFRYVQVDGWPGGGLPLIDDIVALVLHTDMTRRGYFESSNSMVNKLHENVVWSMRGNFLSIPTDCPQRDERLGWTGDLQVFCPTANFLYDTNGMLGNWLEDVAVEQLEEGKGGIPPLVVPNVIPPNWPHIAQAVWDDVVVLTPDALFSYSGDKDLLERQFISMQTWLDQGVDRASDGLWNPDKWQLADWLDPSAPPDDPGNGRTDNIMVANAYLIHTTRVFSRLCSVLGKKDLATKYLSDAERLKVLFQRRYITADGYLMSNSQTGVGLAVQFDLYPKEHLPVAANSLDRLVRTACFRISTGFAGTPVISHALTTVGRTQLAYRMLLEKTCPSWLYPITMGATTIWERWDSMLVNGSINPGQMTSFNHYALGAVADWLHTSVGGISPMEPGWKVIHVRPVPGGNIKNATVQFNGPYGLVVCSWTWGDAGNFDMTLTIPPNSTAVVTLPSNTPSINVGDTPFVTVGSGTHKFNCVFDAGEWPPKPFLAANKRQVEDMIGE
jgi:alpha-L-rhamnosidase